MSEPFDIHNSTPQGSPLSPMSALYTASLLEIAHTWMHRDLMLYVDDGAIFATSAASTAAAASVMLGYSTVLNWLQWNGLLADPYLLTLPLFY